MNRLVSRKEKRILSPCDCIFTLSKTIRSEWKEHLKINTATKFSHKISPGSERVLVKKH